MNKNKLIAYLCSTFVASLIIIMAALFGTEKEIEVIDSIDVAGYWTSLLTIYLKKTK